MARPTLFSHRKFRTLARALESKALAVGTLELLWAVGNDSGDPLLGSAADVEEIADWRGTPGALVEILVHCGFLDTVDGTGYAIHDHYHHAPDYVVRRREREEQRRLKGLSLSDLRREAAKARWHKPDAPDMQTDASEKHLHTGCCASDATPISHLPSPITLRTPLTPLAGGPKIGKREYEKAQAYRTTVHAMRCPHEPVCTSVPQCVRTIALALRQEAEAG